MNIHSTGVFFAFVFLLSIGFPELLAAQEEDPDRWEPVIKQFEAADKNNPSPTNAVLFVGSSSIRGWKGLDKDFPTVKTINRGFGGSQFSDLLYYMDHIVLPYQPRLVLVYEGDNDIAAGKSPERVFKDYKKFVDRVHKVLPQTRIAFIAIKPSLSRWHLADKMQNANRLIREYTLWQPKLEFIDVFKPMIAADGQPRPKIFLEDGLHMNRTGYKLWAKIIRPYVRAAIR